MIASAALNRLEITGCTLEPYGHLKLDGTRADIETSLSLTADYGFTDASEIAAFKQTPDIVIVNSITGPLRIDRPYTLTFDSCIVDVGNGVEDDSSATFAVSGPIDPVNGWGPPSEISGLTVFGRMRIESARGQGGIWVHRLEVLNNQKGCIKFSYFSGDKDRLPQTFACVKAPAARLRFTSEVFAQPAYAQLALTADFRSASAGPTTI